MIKSMYSLLCLVCLMQLMLVSSQAQNLPTPFISKRSLNALQESPKKRSVDFRELNNQCHQDEKVAEDDETVCLLQPTAYFTNVEQGATPEEQFISCQQQFGGEPENAGEGCLRWGELKKCVSADVDVAGRLGLKQWRYKFLCHDGKHDLNANDCLESDEFASMLQTGFDESLIDALAFKGLSELEASGYAELDQKCAQIFLQLDANDDRVLQPKEAKQWIRLYADLKHADDTPLTVGERDRFFRQTVRALILPNWVKGEPYYFTWEGFYAACKNTDTIPLLAELPELDQLADKAPPVLGYQPDSETEPPFEADQNDGAGVSPFDYTEFLETKLFPWFAWANAEGGPCDEFKTIEYENAITVNSGAVTIYATRFDGYVDSQGQRCGEGKFYERAPQGLGDYHEIEYIATWWQDQAYGVYQKKEFTADWSNFQNIAKGETNQQGEIHGKQMHTWITDARCSCSNAGLYTTTVNFGQCDLESDINNFSFQLLANNNEVFGPRQAPNSNPNADTDEYSWSGGSGIGVPYDKYWWTLDGEDQTRLDANWLDWV